MRSPSQVLSDEWDNLMDREDKNRASMALRVAVACSGQPLPRFRRRGVHLRLTRGVQADERAPSLQMASTTGRAWLLIIIQSWRSDVDCQVFCYSATLKDILLRGLTVGPQLTEPHFHGGRAIAGQRNRGP